MLRSAVVLLLLLAHQSLQAADTIDLSELDIKLANPIADLSIVPMQFNYYLDSDNEVVNSVLNFQPAVSVSTENWVFTNRFVTPFQTFQTTQTSESTGDTTTTQASGIGDFSYQLYISPRLMSSTFTFAGGVLLSPPTGVGENLGSGKWGAGPTFAMIGFTPSMTYGGLVYQNWSIAGDDDRRDVSLLTIQPIFAYRFGNLWSFSPFNDVTYNAKLPSEKWTLPLGLQFSKIVLRLFVPMQITAGFFSNLVHPEGAPEGLMRFQMTFII